MECKSCGAQIADESTYCPYCQAVISKPVATQAAANAQPTSAYQPKTKPKGEVWVLILLVLFFWPAAIWYAVTRDMSKSSGENKSSTGTNDAELRHLVPVGRSGLAIAAGYLALFSVLFIPAPFALIFGILALNDIKKHPDKMGKGRAWFGIIMGGIFSFGLLLLVISSFGKDVK